MIIFIFIIINFLTTCLWQRENLVYPTKISEIEEVTLTRPDKASKGKFATIKDLTKDQTIELLNALENAKPVGSMDFIPDYYIVFTTKNNETKRIKINGNKVKGYKSDFSYEIRRLEFLEEF